MPESSSNWFSQLMALRNMTKLTGAIHEAQLLQVKMWPKVLWPTASCEAHITNDVGKGSVHYFITRSGKRITRKDRALVFQLVDWTDTIFDNWDVQVSINGTSVKGEKNV